MYNFAMASRNHSNLFQSKLMADVEFAVKAKSTGVAEKIAAHRLILASCSPVFERMFNGDFKDNGVIDIVDADAESFTEFLQLIYDDNVKLTEENVPTVLALIDKYDVKHGPHIVNKFLAKSVKVSNAITFLELAVEFNLSEPLIDKCEDIICANSKDVLQSPGFLAANEKAVIQIFKSDKLKCVEIDVFNAAICWAKRSLEQKCLNTSTENMGAELKDVLKLIRFPAMKIDEFLDIMKKHSYLFSVESSADILKCITCKTPIPSALRLPTKSRINKKRIEVEFVSTDVFGNSYPSIDPSMANRESVIGFSFPTVENAESISLVAFDFAVSAANSLPISYSSVSTANDICTVEINGQLFSTSSVTSVTDDTQFGRKVLVLKGSLMSPPLYTRGAQNKLKFKLNSVGDNCRFNPETISVPWTEASNKIFTMSHSIDTFITKLYFEYSE